MHQQLQHTLLSKAAQLDLEGSMWRTDRQKGECHFQLVAVPGTWKQPVKQYCTLHAGNWGQNV